MRYPNAKVIAHPECETAVLNHADFIGSTTGLLKYAVNQPYESFIVVTESGILHQMQKEAPHKQFIPAPPNNNCACNDCPHMKLNTLEKIYMCLLKEEPEVKIPDMLMEPALQPLKRMLQISANAGL
jgi:quinolinate synthase